MANEDVISGFKKSVAVAWMSAILICISYVLFKDINGIGLKNTLVFNVVGYFTFPLFYGLSIFIIMRMYILFRYSDKYIFVSDGKLFVGRNSLIAIDEISSVATKRNAIFLKEIVVKSKDGRDIKIKSYVLSRSTHEVTNKLKELLS